MYLQSSFDWQTKTIISDESYDCSAINGNLPGGALPAVCCQAAIGPHTFFDTIAEIRELRLAAVLLFFFGIVCVCVYEMSKWVAQYVSV